jgi:hypothetical protein
VLSSAGPQPGSKDTYEPPAAVASSSRGEGSVLCLYIYIAFSSYHQAKINPKKGIGCFGPCEMLPLSLWVCLRFFACEGKERDKKIGLFSGPSILQTFTFTQTHTTHNHHQIIGPPPVLLLLTVVPQLPAISPFVSGS